MNNSPLVSVLMPVYNCARYIEEAVNSILSQTFADFEFLIVDDASTDDTYQKLERFDDPRIILSKNSANKGLAKNLNDLIAIARGEYIARMDGDDISMPERFQLQVDYLRTHPECGVVGSNYVWIDSEGRESRVFTHPVDDSAIRGGLIYHCNTIIHATTIMRKSVLEKVGGYRPRAGITEDYDLWLRLKDVCGFANIPMVLYKYRQHPAQVGTSRRAEQGAVALMARMYAIERKRLDGEDSLMLFSPEQLNEIREGGFVPPVAGDSSVRRRVLMELVEVLRDARLPKEAYKVSGVIIKLWPFCLAGYVSILKVAFSPKSYRRSLQIARNTLGGFLKGIRGGKRAV